MGLNIDGLNQQLAIVILNYNVYEETEGCVDQILDFDLDIKGIVIVDNASENESVSYLRKKYHRNEKIKIIRSNKNNGFAKGNNLGIRYARRIWKADFVLLLNSDTLMLQGDCLERMLCTYDHKVAVIQSNALRTNGRYTSRRYEAYDVRELLCRYVHLICDEHGFYCPWNYQGKMKVGPHISGCDFLLTPVYFQKFNGLYPLTFLFVEENILLIMLQKAGITIRIAEDACILHKESMSTPTGLHIGNHARIRLESKGTLHAILVRIIPICVLRWIINRGEW